MASKKQTPAPAPHSTNWPLVIGLGLFAVVLAVAALSLAGSRQNAQGGATAPVAGAPRLSVPQTSVDLGAQRFETPVESVFTVSNTGDAPLTILGEPRVELIEGC